MCIRDSFQIGDSLSALYLYSCVNFHKCVRPAFCAASSAVTIAFKLADVKLENSEAYLRKLGKNLSWDFETIYIFSKNEVLNICRYFKGFYINKKTNNIFLKFHHYLFRMPKIIEIGWIFHSEKRKSKT